MPLISPTEIRGVLEIRLREQVRPHLSFYITALILGIGTTLIFIYSDAAGPGWAIKGLPLDDTWIHLVYARNLADHGWFYYNPGVPAAGMSSPLWVVLLAIPLKIGFSPVFSAKILGILFGVLTSFAVYHLADRLFEQKIIAWAAGLFTAIEPNFAFAEVSGMEVPLLAFLLTSMLIYLHRSDYRKFGIVLGFAVVTRGEIAIFGIVVSGIIFLRQYLTRDELTMLTVEERELIVQLFLPALLLGGSWAAFNYVTAGTLLPNTYYVKHNYSLGIFNPDNLNSIWKGYFRHSVLFGHFLALPSLMFYLLGAGVMIKEKGFRVLPTITAPLLFVLALSNNLLLSPEPWNFTARRYLDFLWPLVAIPLIYAMVWIWEQARQINNRWVILTSPLVYAGCLLYVGSIQIDRFELLASEYSWNTRNIEEVSVAMGTWLAKNIPAESTIGVTDAGAMRYFGEHDMIDFLGLNLHRVIGRPLDELILEYRPEYTVLFRSGIIDSWLFLEEIYNIKPERNTILGGSDLVVYKFVGDETGY